MFCRELARNTYVIALLIRSTNKGLHVDTLMLHAAADVQKYHRRDVNVNLHYILPKRGVTVI